MKNRELCLVDGYSVIYRGYFAFLNRPLLNPQGRNSSSVFVFFRTLFQVLRARSPELLVVAMDSRVPTFRHTRYEAYKATRDKAPQDLHAQVPVIEEILAALKVPCIRADGYEADDVIATLAEGCRQSGAPCWILSGDKDILQLIGGNVRLLAQEKGSTDLVEYSREKVFESRGVYPEQIVDFLSLTGDSSDNIPGVPGIGDKTAQKLLAEYGTLDALYSRLDAVSPESVRKKLLAGRDAAMLSRELVTLRRDVPGVPPVEELPPRDLESRDAAALFEREGMKTLVTELAALARKVSARQVPAQGTLELPAGPDRDEKEAGPPDEPARVQPAPPATAPGVELARTAPGTYAALTSVSELDLWLGRARNAGTVALDVETDGLDEMKARPIGFSLSVEEGRACYVPVRAPGISCIPEETLKSRLAALLESPSLRIIGHGVKSHYKVLRRWGIRPSRVHFDTMIAAWVLESDEGSYGLDRLAETRLAFRRMPAGEVGGKDQPRDQVPLPRISDYSGEAADLALRLYHALSGELDREQLAGVFHGIEMPLLTVLSEMELTGIRVLPAELAAYSRELESSLAAIEQEIYTLCGRPFNIASTKQLQEVLFTWRKLTPTKKTRTGFSTDVEVLESLAEQDPVPAKILVHRNLSKLKSTYVDALPVLINDETGRLHTHYVQTGAATGRLASKDPNLQNIPIREEEGRRIRAAFVPAPGMKFVSADYSQIELAILAYLSRDPTLLQAFSEGRDVHRQTASLIFSVPEAEVSADQRRVGKTINFGVVYGMSAFGLAQRLKIPRADADRFITTYFQRYREVDRFLKETIRTAEETGFTRTLLGRRRRVAGITSRNRSEKQAAERVAVNSPIQGSAADIVKIAMIRLSRRLAEEKLSARVLLQVHDEIILEAPADEAPAVEKLVREVMEHATEHPVPLAVHCETGDSWGDFH